MRRRTFFFVPSAWSGCWMLSFNPSVLRRAMSFAPYAAKRPGVFSNRKKMLHQDSGMIFTCFPFRFPRIFPFSQHFFVTQLLFDFAYFFFPQTVWPYWEVLTVSVKARCLSCMVSVASGIFRVISHIKWLLWHVRVHFDCAQARTKRVSRSWRCSIFAVNFRLKMALVACPMCISTEQIRARREISHRHLAKRLLVETLYRGLAKKPLMEILFGDIAKRLLPEILPTELS